MKIVIAPDSFKESLSASEVASALAEGLRRALPSAEIVLVPMADGGEGTLVALTSAQGSRVQTCTVSGPLGPTLEARYGILADGLTAVIEVAEVIGLGMVPLAERDPRRTSSYGVGQLIRSCLDRQLRRFVIGLGGSATVDGGAGMLQALGMRFLDHAGSLLPVPLAGGQLADIASIDFSEIDPRLAQASFAIASDVDNPLCGPRGAAAVFGPQKGATPSDVAFLDAALSHLYGLLENLLGARVSTLAGAGAAGGLGAAFLLVLGAQLRAGVDLVIETNGLAELAQGATVMVTGEGRVDAQTLFGKTPMGVARLARSLDIPVIVVGGGVEAVDELWRSGWFDGIESAVTRPCAMADALRDARSNLVECGMRLGMWLSLSSRVKPSL